MPHPLRVAGLVLLALPGAACGERREAPGPLELTAFAVRDTVPAGDSLPVGWTVRNSGGRRPFRDYAAFYRFTVIAPDGRVVPPEYDQRGHAAAGESAGELGPGAEVRHVVDLGCVTEPLAAGRAAPAGCALRYRLRDAGAYRIVIQHVPLPPPDGSRAPEFLPSAPDTVTLHVSAPPGDQRANRGLDLRSNVALNLTSGLWYAAAAPPL